MRRMRIDILDDDPPFRDSLAFMIAAHGFKVATHSDPLQFLRDFSDAEPSCVICDIRMPVMSGVEVTRALRARNIAAPVILITGHADPALVDYALRAGASLLLEKPVAPQHLVAALARFELEAGC